MLTEYANDPGIGRRAALQGGPRLRAAEEAVPAVGINGKLEALEQRDA